VVHHDPGKPGQVRLAAAGGVWWCGKELIELMRRGEGHVVRVLVAVGVEAFQVDHEDWRGVRQAELLLSVLLVLALIAEGLVIAVHGYRPKVPAERVLEGDNLLD